MYIYYIIIYIFFKGGIFIFFEKDYKEEQIIELKKAIKQNLDISKMLNPKFHWQQLEQIRFGLASKIDVSLYALEIFTFEQMMQIREGLMTGINAALYANPKYTYGQMQILKEFLIRKHDISFMLANNLNEQQMRILYEMLLDGCSISILSEIAIIGYADDCLRIIRRTMSMGCDYKVFTKMKYAKNHLMEIMKLYSQGIDLTLITQRNDLSTKDLKSIKEALELGMDESIIKSFLNQEISMTEFLEEQSNFLKNININKFYLKTLFKDKIKDMDEGQIFQLEEISNMSIENVLKLKEYNFNAEQLEEIKFGYEDDIEILPYINESMDEIEMSDIRNRVLISKKVNEELLKCNKEKVNIYIHKNDINLEKIFNKDFYCERVSGIWNVIRLSDNVVVVSKRDIDKLIDKFISYIKLTEDMEQELIEELDLSDFNK